MKPGLAQKMEIGEGVVSERMMGTRTSRSKWTETSRLQTLDSSLRCEGVGGR